MSEEVRNAIILILAVSIALNIIAPQIVGQATGDNIGRKPLEFNVFQIEHSGSLGQKGETVEPTFSALWPESNRGEIPAYTYPQRKTEGLQTCGICSCFTGHLDPRSNQELNQYFGATSEMECKSLCAKTDLDYIGFTPEILVSCNYNLMAADRA